MFLLLYSNSEQKIKTRENQHEKDLSAKDENISELESLLDEKKNVCENLEKEMADLQADTENKISGNRKCLNVITVKFHLKCAFVHNTHPLF